MPHETLLASPRWPVSRREAGPRDSVPGQTARVCLPGPHPAVRALLAADWRVTGFDLYMATDPGLLDPRRAVPSPALA